MIESVLGVTHSMNVSGNDEILELPDVEHVLMKMMGGESLVGVVAGS